MSPDGTRKIGDFEELPAYAPGGLKILFALGEGVVHEQIRLLGTGTPSKAPNLRELLRNEGVDRPDDQAELLDNYSDHEDEVEEIKSGYEGRDKGISVSADEIGGGVTKAYNAIDTAVKELNEQIVAARGASARRALTDAEGDPLRDADGNIRYELRSTVIAGLFSGLWDTLDTTYEQVSGVSDQAAAEALKIGGNEPAPRNNHSGGPSPMSYPTTASYPTTSQGGGTTTGSVTPTSGSMGTAIIPSGDKPDAMRMMRYLIEEHDFTPAQAAGIVANAKHESDFDVGAKGDWDPKTQQYTAHGLFQWRFDRHAGLQEFASRRDEDIGSWETHIDYMVHELRSGSSYQQAENIVDGNPNDARAVAEGFDRHYERSSGESINDRRDYAAGILEEWNKTQSNIAV